MKTSSVFLDVYKSKLSKSESVTLFVDHQSQSGQILAATVLITLPVPINEESPDKYFAARKNIFVYYNIIIYVVVVIVMII